MISHFSGGLQSARSGPIVTGPWPLPEVRRIGTAVRLRSCTGSGSGFGLGRGLGCACIRCLGRRGGLGRIPLGKHRCRRPCGLPVLLQDRGGLRTPRRQDREHQRQEHEHGARRPGRSGQERGRLTTAQYALRRRHTAPHRGQSSTLPGLEEDHDGEEDPVEYEDGQQESVHGVVSGVRVPAQVACRRASRHEKVAGATKSVNQHRPRCDETNPDRARLPRPEPRRRRARRGELRRCRA